MLIANSVGQGSRPIVFVNQTGGQTAGEIARRLFMFNA
jgi:hypothetical protein